MGCKGNGKKAPEREGRRDWEGDKDLEGRRIGGPEREWTETESEGNGDSGGDKET